MTSHDEHGFPIPKDFDGSDARPQSRRLRMPRSQSARRWLAVGIVLLVIGGLTLPLLRESGPPTLADWYRQRAEQRYGSGDLSGALDDLDRAIDWHPERADFYFLRGIYRLDDHDTEGFLEMSLADFDEALRIDPKNGRFHHGRSLPLLRLGRHREALDAVDRYMEFDPLVDAVPFNRRAYARALAEMELEEGLADVEEAIKRGGTRNHAFLDTRGYLLYLLGRYDSALDDLNEAIGLAERRRQAVSRLLDDAHVEPGEKSFEIKRMDHDLAVLHHHRGLIHQKLDNKPQAKEDLDRGDELGYDPDKGVW
jgi:tetratricopeptide (TPR) repeat protein